MIQRQVREYFARIKTKDITDAAYIKDTSLDFCRKQNLKEAMMISVELLQTCSFDEISKVINESLARARPVIIFEEIKHIIQNRKGIFVSKRDVKSLLETIDFIMKNYISIQESMMQNKLPTKKEFI